jgi:predicted dehydrogenase
MRRLRIGIIGAGAASEWGILPILIGPDAMSPPDSGNWWSRRPLGETAIRWQAPFRPEVVALSASDEERRASVAHEFRLAVQYSAAQDMLRENALDVVFCEDATHENIFELVAQMARSGAKYLWLGGVPAASTGEALELAYWAAAHGVRLWCSRTLRHAAAHRAALRLVKRGEIGDVTALALRWSTPFGGAHEADAEWRAATFAALDLLVACAGVAPQSALLAEAKSTSHLWLNFAGGSVATAIFSSADNWNAALPRLEICGTQGRYLLCEGGRRMGSFRPHEATQWIEPPPLAAHISTANYGGLAEDIKHFLAECVAGKEQVDNADWIEVAHVLEIMRAACESLPTSTPANLQRLRFENADDRSASNEQSKSTPSASATLTLPLALL